MLIFTQLFTLAKNLCLLLLSLAAVLVIGLLGFFAVMALLRFVLLGLTVGLFLLLAYGILNVLSEA